MEGGEGEVASARAGKAEVGKRPSGESCGEGGEWEIGRWRREGGPGGCDAGVEVSGPFVGYI